MTFLQNKTVSAYDDISDRFYQMKNERILTHYDKNIFEVVNFVIICGIVGLFGIVANIINIIIFYKQGFTNTVNIALLGLAVSDLCCLITLEWISTCLNPFLPNAGLPWVIPNVMILSGGWPHVCFSRITTFITVYITAERCLSIAMPLKVKQIVTPRRTSLIICLIYLINLMTLIPEYATSFLGWRFILENNKTLLALLFTDSRKNVEGLCYVIHSMLSAMSFFGVIIFTIALVTKLRQTSAWRKVASSSTANSETVSRRDQKTVKMVVLIACVLIVCYTPGAAVSMATFLVGQDFSITGKYINVCVASWSVACAFETLNSSVNIFLYYRMSSKYRETFDGLFLQFHIVCSKRKKND